MCSCWLAMQTLRRRLLQHDRVLLLHGLLQHGRRLLLHGHWSLTSTICSQRCKSYQLCHAAGVAQFALKATRSDSFAKIGILEGVTFCFKQGGIRSRNCFHFKWVLYDESQESALEDVLETSVMMRFNENQQGGGSRFAERSRLS